MNTVNSSAIIHNSQPHNHHGAAVMEKNIGWLNLWDNAQGLISENGQMASQRGLLSSSITSKERAMNPLFAMKASIKNEGQSTNLQLISSEYRSRIVLNPDGSIELGHSWSQQIFDVFQQSLSKFDSLIADALQRLSDSWASLGNSSSLPGLSDSVAEPSPPPASGIEQSNPSRNISETTKDRLPRLKKPKTLPKMGDFLWKPVAEKDGKLVVLLPSKLTGDVNRVRLLSPDGKQVIGQSNFSGIGNGNRGHYRFAKPGAEYPANTKVEIIMDNGNRYRVNIPSTGKRVTR